MDTLLKDRLKSGESTIGSWLSLGSIHVAEIMADAGFDWLVLDVEHSAMTISQVESIVRYLDSRGCPPLVRVSENRAIEIRRVMDAGAHGVVVPMVNSQADAQRAVNAVRYPPAGTRGVGLCRANGYGLRFDEYREQIDATAVVIAQIEHADAIQDLEQILAVEGVDGTIIGPYDLSASIGMPGDFDNEEVQRLVESYRSTAIQAGSTMGIHVVQPDPEAVRAAWRQGYRFLAFSTDYLLLRDAASSHLGELRLSIRDQD